MGLSWKKSDTHNHLSGASKRHNGTHTVTPTAKAAAAQPKEKHGSPFGELILGPGAGTSPTAYKSILGL